MKILFAIKSLNGAVGGAEKVLCLVASALSKRGHEVVVLTFDLPGGGAFFELSPDIARCELGMVQFNKKTTPFNLVKSIPLIRERVKLNNPDVAVGFMHSMFVPLSLALWGTGIPTVGSEHVVSQYYSSYPLEYLAFMAVAPLMSNITVLSESVRAGYVTPIRKKMTSIPNPLLVPKASRKNQSEKSRFILLSVGRFVPEKDHVTLIKAFHRVSGKYPNWDLRIIGEGPLRSELEELVKNLGVQERVFLPGTTKLVDKEYQNADLFAVSSIFESFGMVTGEAMSWGLPAVGFADCSGTNELIQDLETGLLATSIGGRVAGLADRLDLLMSDPILRQRFGEQAKKMIESRFGLDQIVDQWERLLKASRRRA